MLSVRRMSLVAALAIGVITLLVLASTGLAQEAAAPVTAAPGGAPAPSNAMGGFNAYKALDWFVVLPAIFSASVAGIAIIIDAIIHLRQKVVAPEETTEHIRSLIEARQFKELLEFTSEDQSFISYSLNAGLRRAHLGYAAMREAMESAIGERISSYFRRIEMLNIIGNIGPLIGLFGTVLGMIEAFNVLGTTSGNAKPSDLASGISKALWHTFFGLGVALPCLVFYGMMRTKIDKMTSAAAMTVEELLESVRPEKGSSSSSATSSGGSTGAKVIKKRAEAVEEAEA